MATLWPRVFAGLNEGSALEWDGYGAEGRAEGMLNDECGMLKREYLGCGVFTVDDVRPIGFSRCALSASETLAIQSVISNRKRGQARLPYCS